MSILKVSRMGHPVLRTKARTVDKAELKNPMNEAAEHAKAGRWAEAAKAQDTAALTTLTPAQAEELVTKRKGALKLDDPIAKYYPAAPAGWSGITLRHLLNHTSGIPDFVSTTNGFIRNGARLQDKPEDRTGARQATGIPPRIEVPLQQHRLRPAGSGD